MRYTLNQEQQRFNNSFDLILENFRLAANDTFNELIATQQKVSEETLKNSVAQQNMNLKNLTKDLKTTITKMQQQIVSNSARVAMTACVKSGNTVNGVVKFNDIKTNSNISNLSYFKSNGKFTIETEGLYLISTRIFTHTNGAIYALYQNGNIIALVYAHYDTDTNHGNGGSASAIVSIELKAGDAVWVQTTKSMYVYDIYSCFTVVKLK